MISLLGNPNSLANVNAPESHAPAAKPPAATVPVDSRVRWWRTMFDPAPLLEEPTGNERPVGIEIATSFEPWDQWPRLDGGYAVVARPTSDPNLTGGQATWDIYSPTMDRGEPVPWDAVGF